MPPKTSSVDTGAVVVPMATRLFVESMTTNEVPALVAKFIAVVESAVG